MRLGRILDREKTLWCAGLPLVGERRLDRSEQEQLRLAAWRLLWQGLGAFLGVAVLGIGLIVGTAELDKYWGGSLIVITVVFIALLLSLPATLFAREGWTQRGFLTFRDLRHASVRVFEGVLTDVDLLEDEERADASQRRLISLGLLTVGSSELQTIEVLPVSRRVWRVGDKATIPWVEALWQQVSNVPAASPWLHNSSPLISESSQHSRRFSEGERAELRRETRRHWLGPFVVALLLTALLVVLVISTVLASGILAGSTPAGGILKGINWWEVSHIAPVTFAADTFFLSRWAQARKLYQDIRGGEVLVEFSGSFPGRDQPMLPTERLPKSERIWTQAGRPAAWRRIGR